MEEKVYKLCLVGDSGVGKSSILKRYIHNTFSQYTDSTIGAQYFSKNNSTCTAADNTTQEKYTYYSFKPMGTVGGVDLGGIGGTQSGSQGLVMGILESLTQVNPNKMIANVRNASSSKCVKVTAPITIKEDETIIGVHIAQPICWLSIDDIYDKLTNVLGKMHKKFPWRCAGC